MTENSPVLAFDPSGRRSSRRVDAAVAALEHAEAAQHAEALAMGLTETECGDFDLCAHAPLIRDVEAAYAAGPAAGRAALLSVLMAQYNEGYDVGSQDGLLPLLAGHR